MYETAAKKTVNTYGENSGDILTNFSLLHVYSSCKFCEYILFEPEVRIFFAMLSGRRIGKVLLEPILESPTEQIIPVYLTEEFSSDSDSEVHVHVYCRC